METQLQQTNVDSKALGQVAMNIIYSLEHVI